jgi:dienelactone hydrolase
VTTSRSRRRAALAGAAAVVALTGFGAAVLIWRPDSSQATAATAAGPATKSTAAAPTTVPPTSSTTTPVLPSETSAQAVGVETLTLVDAGRTAGARGARPAGSPRVVPVTVRYPVAGIPGSGESEGALPIGSAPLVVFAHGFDVSQATYASLLHDLAAAGFVVAAPDFPLSTSAAPGAAVEGDEAEQARDVSLVIDRLSDGTTAPALTAAIRPGPVGVVGHSDGAVTVLLAAYSPAYADPRIGAVVDVSGAFDDFGGRWFTTQDPPLLSLHGGADELNPLSADRALVSAQPGPAALVVVDGASHLGALTGPSEAVVARLVADDLAWRLEGAIGAEAAVAADESLAPLHLDSVHR